MSSGLPIGFGDGRGEPEAYVGSPIEDRVAHLQHRLQRDLQRAIAAGRELKLEVSSLPLASMVIATQYPGVGLEDALAQHQDKLRLAGRRERELKQQLLDLRDR